MQLNDFLQSIFVLNVIFNHSTSQYNGENYRMPIRIIYSIRNRSIHNIMGHNRSTRCLVMCKFFETTSKLQLLQGGMMKLSP